MNFTDQTPPLTIKDNSFNFPRATQDLENSRATSGAHFRDSDLSNITIPKPHNKTSALSIETSSKATTLDKLNNLSALSAGSPQFDIPGQLWSHRSGGEADSLLHRKFPASPGQGSVGAIQIEEVIREKDEEHTSSPISGNNSELRPSKMHTFLKGVSKKMNLSPKGKANPLNNKGKSNLDMPQYVNFDIQENNTEENGESSPGIRKKGKSELYSQSSFPMRSPKSLKTLQVMVPNNNENDIGTPIEQNIDSPENIIDINTPNSVPENSSNPSESRSITNNTTSNRSQTNQILVPMNLRAFYEPETNIHLVKFVGLCIAIIIGSINFYLMVNSHFSFHGVFVTVFSYTFFLSLVDTCWTLNAVGDEWLLTDDVFHIYDAFISSFILLMIYVKILHILPLCSFAAVPFIPEIVLFWRYSFSTLKVKILKTVARCLFMAQVLLITLKLDGLITWSWQEIMIVGGILLVWKTINTISSIFSVIRKVYKSHFFKRGPNDSSQFINKVFVFIWYLAYQVTAPSAYIIVFLALKVYITTHEPKTLNKLIYLNVGICLPVLLSIVLVKNHIIKFISMFGLIESHLIQQEIARPKKPVITLQAEKQTNHYFVMLSSTYFRPLHDRMLAKSQESYQRFKNIISDVSIRKARSKDKNQQLDSQRLSKKMQMEEFRQNKTTLDQKLAHFLTPRFGDKKEEKEDKESPVIQHLNRTDRIKTDINQTIEQDILKYNTKKCAISFDNLDALTPFQDKLAMPTPDGEEALCLFCYTNPPNVILMNCGHGGICYECAVTMVKKKDECHECRATVEAICKIDPNPKFSNIIKVVELNKLIKTMD